MGHRRDRDGLLRGRVLAAVLAPMALLASAGGSGQDASRAGTDAVAQGAEQQRASGRSQVYSVINLAPDPVGVFLNERGQAAYFSFVYGTNSFFDGDRSYDLGSLGGGFTLIRGLNNRGTVTGQALQPAEPFSVMRSFVWTRRGGMRALPEIESEVFDINDRNQVVGRISAMNTAGRAARWDPDGQVRPLGPLPPYQSAARTINERGQSGGFADVADGSVHAMLWDPAGRQRELGTIGGEYASADFLNERGEAAGQAYDAANQARGFFWSARSGLVPLLPQRAGDLYISGLNEQGRIAGIVQSRDQPATEHVAFRWSLSRGIEWLAPSGPGIVSDVTDLNNRNQIVGSVGLPGAAERAVRWDGSAYPVDLNTQLYRPPAGLVLHSALAINDAGTILANSSAGLVMLRPGTRGTDAPVLGPVTGLPGTVVVGQEVRGTVGFVDSSRSQTHAAVVEWGDGCTSPHPSVTEAGGVGQVGFQHRFCAVGVFYVTVRVTDSSGRTTDVARHYAVDAPGLAAIGGHGTLMAGRDGAGRKEQALRFMLWAPLAATAPAAADTAAPGRAQLRISGPFSFLADRIGVPSREGTLLRIAGTGRYNGRAGYRFLVEASDGDRDGAAGGDRLRVRIVHTEPGGRELVDYDNGAMAHETVSQSFPDRNRTLVKDGGLSIKD